MHFKQEKFSFNGISINFIESGKGPTIVFLPGWGTRPQTYKKALTLLSKKYHVVSPELPGFSSYSSPKTIWNFGDYANFFSAFLESLPIKDVILMGQSLGGGFALFTTSQSKKVKKLILIDAFGLPTEHSRIKLSLLYSYQVVIDSLDVKLLNTTLNNIFNFCKSIRHLKYITMLTYHIFDKQVGIDKSIFHKITVPTIILWGHRDTIFGKQTATNLNKALSQSSLYFVNGTHNWIIFHPEHLNNFL